MRRLLLICVLLLTITIVRAGKLRQLDLLASARLLDRALEQKDTAALRRMLSPQLQYGHSNGWIETKEDMIADLYNGKLVYNKIDWSGGPPSVVIEGKTGLLREEMTVDIVYEGKPMKMKLSVLQVWGYRKGAWILLGRQSVKVG